MGEPFDLADESEVARVYRWRLGMIADLGEDLRRCVRLMFPDKDGMLSLLAVARRFGASSVLQQGMMIYWNHLGDYLKMASRTSIPEEKGDEPWNHPETSDQKLP